jgi:predicted transcriptional regulator
MKLKEVLQVIDGKVISADVDLDQEVRMGGGADLMSDVLAFAQEGMLLMTGLTNPQVVRTAEMAGVVAVVIVRGKIPPPGTIALAQDRGIPLLASKYTMFETCGRLYRAGLAASGLFEMTLKRWHEAFGNKQ